MNADETNTDDLELATAIEPDEETDIDTEAQASAKDNDEPDPDADDTDKGQDGEEGEGQPEEIEYAEIELNGKKYQVPVELKDGYLMQSDYTRKTQEVAEQRKQAEAYMAEVQKAQVVSEQELHARAELLGITQRLEQYKTVDWNAWQDEDPISAQKGWIEYQQMRDKAGTIGQHLEQVKTQRSEQAEQETARRLQETRAFAEKEIKGWTPEVDKQIVQHLLSKPGIQFETLKQGMNPAFYEIAYEAWVGRQALQKQQTAKPTPTTPVLKPLAKVSPKGGAPAQKSMSEMSMEEYAAYMNKREAASARR
jgi:hypothetical protein